METSRSDTGPVQEVTVPVSVIVPVFNGAARLPALLQTLADQDFPRAALEIIIVDDDSTDDTRPLAEAFGCTIVRNGKHSPEVGKALGLRAASHEFVLFIDDDNRLSDPSWLRKALTALLENPDAVGVQSAWFSYRRADPPINRWCSLYGVGDPLAFYMKRSDHLSHLDKSWTLNGSIIRDTPEYWLVRFDPHRFPTLGSQGFLTRKSLQQRVAHWPMWLHIDANRDLAQLGFNEFVFLKDEVVHEYCSTVSELLRKLRRNIRFFLSESASRSYRWDDRSALVPAVLRMTTVVDPLLTAVRMFSKTGDVASFLHPYLCLTVPLMYASEVIRHRLKKAR